MGGLFIISISNSITGFGVLIAVTMNSMFFWPVLRKMADNSEENIASICSSEASKKAAR
jgi:hypothetical protein